MRSSPLAFAAWLLGAALVSGLAAAEGAQRRADSTDIRIAEDSTPAPQGLHTGSRTLDLLLEQRQPQPEPQSGATAMRAASAPTTAASASKTQGDAIRDAMIREALNAGLVEMDAAEAKLRQDAAERSKSANSSLEKAIKVHSGAGGVPQAAGDDAVPPALLRALQGIVNAVMEFRFWILGFSVVALALVLAMSGGKSGRPRVPPSKPMGKGPHPVMFRHRSRSHRRYR